jgi:hypothetical protein
MYTPDNLQKGSTHETSKTPNSKRRVSVVENEKIV